MRTAKRTFWRVPAPSSLTVGAFVPAASFPGDGEQIDLDHRSPTLLSAADGDARARGERLGRWPELSVVNRTFLKGSSISTASRPLGRVGRELGVRELRPREPMSETGSEEEVA